MIAAVDDLAQELMCGINSAAVVTANGLVGAALFASPQHALAQSELLSLMGLCLNYLKKTQAFPSVSFAVHHPNEALERAKKYAPIRQFEYPGEDVIYLDEQEGIYLSYVRNNIIHLFSLVSAVCLQFKKKKKSQNLRFLSR